jgi:hypothetical protein
MILYVAATRCHASFYILATGLLMVHLLLAGVGCRTLGLRNIKLILLPS